MINWNLVKFLSISYGKNASSNVALTIEISLLISPLRFQACCIFMISKIKFTPLLTNFHRKVKYCKCLIFFLLSPERCRSLFSGSCIVLYCRSLSSMAQPLNEGLTLETSALETLHAYGGQFTLSTQFIKPNFPFNSTLNRS